jgi:dUTP pyrophosphatase
MKNDRLIYLAHPIDMGRACPDLLNYAVGELQALGLPTYNPLTAFNVSGQPSGVINRVNEAAMLASSGAVAFLPKDVQTIGTPAEVSWLASHGKPVLILSDNDVSWVVAGWRGQLFTEVHHLDEEGVSAGIDWLTDRMSYLDDNPEFGDVEPIVFEKAKQDATLPTKGYADDAGYDLYASDEVIVPARGQATVPLGVKVDIPEGLWAQITGRSSTLKNLNLMVAPTVGVIDEGYTGELFAPVVSNADEDVKIERGQRIAQLILHEAPGQRFTPVWGVARRKERGANGFGSTGR